MGLVVYADFSAFSRINLPLTICTLGFGGVGWFLITRRHLPMSRKAKILVVPIICLLAGFVFLAVIPSIIAGLYARSQNACVNNLRRIDGAKQVWALENRKSSNDIPTSGDIAVYLKDGKLPTCPSGGTYIIGRVGEDPKCPIGNSAWPNSHVLPNALNETNSSWADWWFNFKMAYCKLLGLRPAPPTP